MLKTKGPKIDPFGTPLSTFPQFTKRAIYFTTLKSSCETAFHKNLLNCYLNHMF